MQSVQAGGLKLLQERSLSVIFWIMTIESDFFGRSSRVLNSVIRLDGILFLFKGVIQRCKFDVTEHCFVWNLQWSCEELDDFS